MTDSLFETTPEEKLRLGLRKRKKETIQDRIFHIFEIAQKEGKNELTIDEVTIAYYNLYTKFHQEHTILNRGAITLQLFLMKGSKRDDGILELVKRGVYRIRK